MARFFSFLIVLMLIGNTALFAGACTSDGDPDGEPGGGKSSSE